MTTYAKITDFASKDALLTGNPAKIVKGVEIDDEFNAIATADATSVKGPIGVTVDNTVVRWDGTTGRAVQGSGVTISDAGLLTSVDLNVTGNSNIGDAAATDVHSINGITSLVANSANPALSVTQSGAGVGLAVTGALSATGTLSLGPSSTSKVDQSDGTAGRFKFGDAVSGNSALRINATGTGNISLTGIAWNNSATARGIEFGSGGTINATLDIAGNLGLGVTPSAWGGSAKALDIGSWVGFGMAASGGGANVTFNAYNSTGTTWNYKISSLRPTRYETADGAHVWYTAPSGTAGTAITFTQSLAVGKGTTLALEGATSAVGTGIAFPATQLASSNANTLDDYEQGTFTPTVIGTGTVGVGTYTTQIGRYTKIGNIVYYVITFIWNAHTGTGDLQIAGLPFTSEATTGNQPPGAVYFSNLTYTANSQIVALVNNNSTSILIRQIASGGAAAVVPLDTAASLYVSGHYEV